MISLLGLMSIDQRDLVKKLNYSYYWQANARVSASTYLFLRLRHNQYALRTISTLLHKDTNEIDPVHHNQKLGTLTFSSMMYSVTILIDF